MTPKEFFSTYYRAAVASEESTGVPALFKLAQAAIESAWGAKVVGNNFFGIKADPTWKGPKNLITTTEVHASPNIKYPVIISVKKRPDNKWTYKVKDYFRAYNNPIDSFIDQSKFLTTQPRYKSAFQYKDPILFAKAVAAAGYATSPDYATLLEKVIKMFIPMTTQK